MVEFVQLSGGEPATAELGRGDHDGQTINGLPEDLVGELVSLVGTGPSSPATPVSASSPSEPDAIRIVLSAVCPQGHPNPTNYTVCRVCGAELNRPAKSVACPLWGAWSPPAVRASSSTVPSWWVATLWPTTSPASRRSPSAR